MNHAINETNGKFAVIRSLRRGACRCNIHWTTHQPGWDHTTSTKGEVWYEVVAYTLTSGEAVAIMDALQDPREAFAQYLDALPPAARPDAVTTQHLQQLIDADRARRPK